MQAFETIPVLNRLLALLCRSLPAYLADARPWTRIGRQEIQTLLDRLAADQQRYARRVAEAITRRRRRPNPGHFPAEFTAKNDLALDFLFREVVAHQEHDVAMIERCAAELGDRTPPCTPWPRKSLATPADISISAGKLRARTG